MKIKLPTIIIKAWTQESLVDCVNWKYSFKATYQQTENIEEIEIYDLEKNLVDTVYQQVSLQSWDILDFEYIIDVEYVW